jgi:hypothetical protein
MRSAALRPTPGRRGGPGEPSSGLAGLVRSLVVVGEPAQVALQGSPPTLYLTIWHMVGTG